MARHQSRKGGQLGQQALLRGTQRGLSMRISGAQHQTSSLRGEGWKLWGWQVDENLGGAPLLSKSHSNCPAKVGEIGEAERPVGWQVCGAVGGPLPREWRGGRNLERKDHTKVPDGRKGEWPPGGKPEMLAGVRGGQERTTRPQVVPKGPEPTRRAGGIFGVGPGQQFPRRRGVPSKIDTPEDQYYLKEGRGEAAWGLGGLAASG